MHGILQNDYMFSARGIFPWHSLGTVLGDPPTSEDALRVAKLDWDVIQVPGMFIVDGVQYTAEEFYYNVRSDTKTALGSCSNKYKIIQNREAFAFVDALMAQKDTPCRYETAGSLWNGKRVWMTIELPSRNILGDKVANYLIITNSHDGLEALKGFISSIRVVCQNTLTLAETHAVRKWKYNHTGDIAGHQREAALTLGLSTRYLDEMETAAMEMSRQRIEVDSFLAKLFEIDDDLGNKAKQTILDTRAAVKAIAIGKDDLQNFRGDGWGMFNAVSDFLSHVEPKRETDTAQRTKFLQFVDGSSVLAKAERLILAA